MERRGNHRHSAGRPWYLRTLSMILAITMILTSTGVTALAESQDVYPESATEQQAEAPAQAEQAAPAPQPETAAPVVETQPETAAPVAETQAETAAPETSAPKQEETAAPAAETETAAPATEAETKGETVTESGKTTKTQNKEETTEKESKAEEKETKKDIVYKMVTFDVADGAVVTVKQKQIEKSSGDHTAKAEDGKIVFSINVKDGYRLERVLVDGSIDARKNNETAADNDYIIEGILTDNTVVTVTTSEIETEPQTAEAQSESETETVTEEETESETAAQVESETTAEETETETESEIAEETEAETLQFTGFAGGVWVKASVSEGTFPAGTQMLVSRVSKSDALNAAEAATGADENVVDAIAVDITFMNKEGNEIQPADGHSVNVSLSVVPSKSLEGENFTVLHQDDNGAVTTVTENASANGASFAADSFSIYIIYSSENPAIATYIFHGADGSELSTQKLKTNEILYSPATPEKEGKIFAGWTKTAGSTTVDHEKFEQEKVTVSNTETINYYPVYQDALYVYFMDNYNRVSTTKQGKAGDKITTDDVTIPLDSTHSVTGWYDGKTENADGTIQGSGNKADDTITLADANVTLYPMVEEGHYLYFATGEGASYIKPAFYTATQTTAKPADPTRPGYTFAGWATTENATRADYNFGEKLSDSKTIYAVWTAKNDTTYTVIIWKQSISDAKNTADAQKTYDYEWSETRTGKTGETVNPTNADRSKNYSGFTYNNAKSKSVTIAGDGTTVLNVYYDRNLMTIRFNNIYTYTATTSNSGTQYGMQNGQYIPLYRYWGNWYDYNGNWYYGTRYTLSPGNETYTGLYGQTLAQNGYTWPSNQKWSYSEGYLSFLDAFLFDGLGIGNSTTLSLNSGSLESGYTVRFYKQNLDGSYSYASPNNSYGTRAANWTFTNKYTGFTMHSYIKSGSTPNDNSSWNTDLASGTYIDNNLYIRYTRNSYDLEFYNYNTKDKTEKVLYEGSLKDLGYEPSRPSGLDSVYEFKGWYKDPACTEKFDFNSTMPASGLIIYAKWEAPTSDARIHSTVKGEDGDTVNKITLNYGEKISASNLPMVKNAAGDVEFTGNGNEDTAITMPANSNWAGWVTYENGKPVAFNLDTQVFSNMDLYPYWIDSKALKVTYKPGEGSGSVVDDTKYAKNSQAEVKASTGLNPPTGKVFLYWKDANNNEYYPGDKIDITDNVELTAVYGDTPEDVSLEFVNTNSESTETVASVKDPRNVPQITLTTLKDTATKKFLGWSKDKDATEPKYKAGDQISIDSLNDDGAATNTGLSHTLYSVWQDRKPLKITITGNQLETKYDAQPHTVNGYTFTADVEGKVFNNELPDGLTLNYSGSTTTITGTDVADSNTINLTKNDFSVVGENIRDYQDPEIEIKKNIELKITKRTVTLTSATDSKKYDGKALTNSEVTVGGDGFATGEGASYDVTGSQTLVGNSENTFTYALQDNTKADNYTITTANGTLTVTSRDAKYDITVEANSDTAKYDGTEKSVSGFKTLVFEVEGSKYTVNGLTAEAKGTNAGEYAANVTGTAVVKDATGNDVTAQFAVNTKNGKLTIDKRTVTLTSATDDKEYDGTALTNDKVTVSGDGFATGEGASYDVTGTQTLVGSSDNTFTYTLNDGTLADNYDITTEAGTLTVKDRTEKYEIKVIANSDTAKYDGTEKSVSGFETLEFTVNQQKYTVEGLTAEAKGTNAGEYTSKVTGSAVVKDAGGNDVTKQFTVTTKDGKLTITKRTVTLTSATDEKEYDGTALTNSEVTVGGDGFATGEGASYDVTGTQTLVGSSNNAFTYTLNDGTLAANYDITTKAGTLTVKDRTEKYEITVKAKSATEKYEGTEKSVSGFETLEFTVNGQNFTVSGLTAGAKGTDAGEYTSEVTGTAVVKDAKDNDVTAQFTVKTEDGKLTITKRSVTLTSATDSKEYDGTALTNSEVTVGGDGFATGEGATYDVTGSQTIVGESKNVFTYKLNDNTNEDNYNITTKEGTLKVIDRTEKYEITVEAKSATEKYDGTEKSVSGFKTLEFTVNEQKYTVEGLSAEAKGTDAGEYSTDVTGSAVVKDVKGNDVTKQFTVTTKDGKLTIAKRTVKLTSATDSKKYDGKALTNKNVTVTEDGFADGEGASYDVTGTQTVVGSSENTFTYALQDNTKADNYTITTANGTLTVTSRDAKYEITVEANSANEQYDGTEKSVSGFKTLEFEVDGSTYTVSGLTAEAKGTNAGEYAANVTGTAVVKDAKGNDVTEQFAVSTKNGKLTIGQRTVTLTSATDEKEYDGTALTNSEVTVGGDGFAKGEGATYDVTGTQTLVGSSDNTFTYSLNDGTLAANYKITTKAGTLTVNDRTKKYEITVTAKSATAQYEGTEKSVSGFEKLGFTFDEQQYIVEGLTAEAKAANAGEYTSEVTGTAVVKDAGGNDVTKQFTVTTKDGKLTIDKRTVTLTSATDEKEYDGTALTNSEVTVGGDGFATGEGASYDVTGTQTLVGSSDNAFTYTLNDGTLAANYNITTEAGTLTVTDRTEKYEITVTAKSATAQYEGTEKSVSGFETLEFTVNEQKYTVEGLTAEAKGTNAGEYTSKVTGTAVVKDAGGNDVTKQFTVTTKDGKLTITKRNVTLTSATDEKEYDGTALTNSEVTVGGDGFVTGEGASYHVTGTQTLVGSSDNTFTYTLNDGTLADNYNITTEEGTLTVKDRSETYKIEVVAKSATAKYDGTEKSVSGFETLEFTVNEQKYTVEGLTAEAKGTDAGEYTSKVTGTAVVKDAGGNDVTKQFTVTTKDGKLTIAKRTVKLTSATDSKKYDGKALTNKNVTVTEDGFADGEGATYDVTGTQTVVGSSENTFTYALQNNTKADNYTITTANGTLTVTSRDAKYEITVEANSDTEKYDGNEKSVSGFKTLEFEVDGSTYTVSGLTAEAKGTNAGSYAANVTGTAVVKDAKGNDVTEQFAVSTKNGQLTIDKRTVTLTSATDEKEYDGTALTNSEVTVGGDGFAKGEGATYDVTGTQTLVGSSDNAFTYTLNDGTLADNYDITTEAGTLTVKDRTEKYEIKVIANSDTAKYDGTEKSVSGFETLEFTVENQKYTVEGLTAEAKAANAGEYTSNVTGTAVVKDAGGNDVTNQFTVSTEDGKLIIDKRAVTLTSATDEKEYDGTALTNDKVTVSGDGFVTGEGASYDVTGTQTLVGSSDNTFTYTLNDGTLADNYNITTKEGTLTVKDRTQKYEITVEAKSATEKYDGTEKSVSGFKTLEFTVNEQKYTVEGLSAEAKGTDAGEYTSEVTGSAVVKDVKGNDVTKQFTVTTKDGKLTIAKRTVKLTSATDSKKYDGKALTNKNVTVSEDGFAKGEGATYDVTGTQTVVGSSENTFTYALQNNTKADNYTITTANGTLTVISRDAKFEITVEANSDTAKYDGNEKSVSGFKTLEFEVDGSTYTVSGLTAEAKGTNAGEYAANITGTAVVKDAKGNDVTEQFAVSTKNGKLTIDKRNVTLTSATDEKEYDGTALTNSDVTVGGDGFATGEGASYDVTGTQTLVGSSDNAFTYTLNDGTLAANYDITTEAGTLTVTDRTEKYEITVEAKSATAQYDGTEKSVSGFENETGNGIEVKAENGLTYYVTGLTSKAAVTDVADSVEAIEITGTEVVKDADGNDVTDQFNVTKTPGSLTITKRDVTLESDDLSKKYDGTALVNGETPLKVEEGWADGEGATYTFTGSQTLVGSSDNSFTYKLYGSDEEVTPAAADENAAATRFNADDAAEKKTTKASNYNITVKFGTLTVTDENVNKDDVVQKTHKGEKFGLGDTVTFEIEVTNIYAEKKTITLTELPNVTLDQTVFTDVEPGKTVKATATYTVTEEDIKNRSFKNTVTASFEGGKDWTDEDIVDVEDPNFKLSSVKTVTNKGTADNGAFKAGETAEFAITITNEGNQTQTDVLVEENLAGAEFVAGDGYTVTENKATITSIAPGETVTVNATYVVKQSDIDAGTLKNVATVNGKGNNPDDPTDPIPDPDKPGTDVPVEEGKPHLTIAKEAISKAAAEDGKYVLNEEISWRVTVTNDGNQTISDVEVTDELTGDTWTVKEALAPNDSVEFIAKYTVTEADIVKGSVKNVATGTGFKPNTDPDSDKPDVPVTPGEDEQPTTEPVYELKTAKKVTNKGTGKDGAFKVGETAMFDITVKNVGNQTQTNVTVEEKLADAQILSGTGYAVKDNVATIAEIKPDETVVVKASYEVKQSDIDAGKLTNVAKVTGNSGDPEDPHTPEEDPDEPKTPVPVDEGKPAVTTKKAVTNSGTGENGSFKAGETAKFVITVTNTGNVTQTNISVVEKLEGAEITVGAYSVSDDKKEAIIPQLAPGTSAEVYAEYTVTEADILKGDLKNVATVKVNGNDPEDPNKPENPQDPEAPVPLEKAAPALKVTKVLTNKGTGENGAFKAGETAEFSIKVENAGNVTLDNVVIRETLADAKFVKGKGYSLGNSKTEATVVSLAVGESVTVKATYVIKESDLGHTVTNTVTSNMQVDDDTPKKGPKGTADVPTVKPSTPANNNTTPKKSTDNKAPKTGDETPVAPYSAATIISLLGVLLILEEKRRRRVMGR